MSAGQGERASFKYVVPVRSTMLQMVHMQVSGQQKLDSMGRRRRPEVGTRWGRDRGKSVGSYTEKWGM